MLAQVDQSQFSLRNLPDHPAGRAAASKSAREGRTKQISLGVQCRASLRISPIASARKVMQRRIHPAIVPPSEFENRTVPKSAASRCGAIKIPCGVEHQGRVRVDILLGEAIQGG